MELEIISDIDMHLFIEKRMRGGISYIAKRYSKENNKCMQSYDDKKSYKYITYIDENNLYSWVMNQYLPYGRFKWLNQNKIDKFDLNFIEENSFDGYILEVDLDYPDELHKLHNNYPLGPKKLEISYDTLSNYCCTIANKYVKEISGVNKLFPNLDNKNKYVLHYKNIPLHLSLGIKLVIDHKI